MYCKNCGNNLKENAKFCQNCGASINGEQTIQNNQTNQNQPKKSNGCLTVFIIVLLIFVFFIPIFLVLGGFSLFIKGVLKIPAEKSCCTDAGGTWSAGECIHDDDFDVDEYNKCVDDGYKITIGDDDDEEDELKINKDIKKYTDSFKKYEKTKEVELTNGNTTIKFKINNNKEVERIENGNTTIENLNGEKAKYIIGTDQMGMGTTNYCTNMYILTEEGNLYYWAAGLDRNEIVKINSNYNFENVVIVPTKIDDKYVIDANNLYNFIPIPKAFSQSYLAFGVTNNNEYITINTYYPFLNIGKPEKYLVGQFRTYGEANTVTQEYLKAFDTIFVYSDGSLNYTSANKLMELVSNQELYKNVNTNENVVNENNKKLKAKLIFKQEQENSTFIVTTDNQVYEVTSDVIEQTKSDENKGNLIVPLYNKEKVEKINLIEKQEAGIEVKRAEIVFKDGTKKSLEGYGYMIYE